jgi:hypothetical protein
LLWRLAENDNAAMEAEPPKADLPKRKCRRFQFRLRTLLLFVMICAIPCAWLGWQLERQRLDREIRSRLRVLGRAFHEFNTSHGAMPPAAIFSRAGKPLLSWRVAILPLVGEGPLYDQFKFDEPWDSPHNLLLLAKMPAVYAPLRGPTPKQPYSTYYQVFTGSDAPFNINAGAVVGKDSKLEGPLGPKLSDFSDGTSQTFLIVESSEGVPWTKPADIMYDAAKPLPELGFGDRFYLVLADASAHFIKKSIPEAFIRGGITPHGQPVGRPWDGNEGQPREPILISDQRTVLDEE